MSLLTDAPPLVAVVTPVYNGEGYLRAALDAVQAQTYPNLVHVVHDNASTDRTSAILAEYKDAKVPVLVARNETLLSLNDNWNAAVARVPAEAAYFRVLCADDEIAPDYIRRTVEVAERHPNVGMVACLHHNSDGTPVEDCWPKDREVMAGAEVLARYFRGECWLPTNHVLFRRTELKPGHPFYEQRIFSADRGASLAVLARSDMGFVPADLAMTRMHETSNSSTTVMKKEPWRYEWLYYAERYARVALGPRASAERIALYRRYYLRQLLKWRLKARGAFDIQQQGLRALGVAPSLLHYGDAMLDFVLVRFGVRPVWGGFTLEWK